YGVSTRVELKVCGGLCRQVVNISLYSLDSHLALFNTDSNYIPHIKRQHKGHITFSGDKIPSDESAIVISNHQSFTDFLHAAFSCNT
ncbi:1826_t:CDS:2, partial [Dentiscutata heterogama]